MVQSTIFNKNSAFEGGGIFSDDNLLYSVNLMNCIFSYNADNNFNILKTTANITNCTLFGDTSLHLWNGAIVSIRNSILWGQSNYNITHVTSGYAPVTLNISSSVLSDGESSVQKSENIILNYASTNLDADPLLLILLDGYHLTTNSPCIDAGIDAGVYDDIDGDLRPQGLGFDIGADEYVGSSDALDLDIARFTTY